MKKSLQIVAASLMAFSVSAFAGEFSNQCAWGLAHDKRVSTDCSVNALGADGKTYCFSSEKARESFMKDPVDNAKRATDVFGRT